MNTVDKSKYPDSAALFQFCKEAMKLTLEDQVKIIDQDVGAILNYEPADCSHWKRGNKNINSILKLRALSNHFKIDERIPIGIVSGEMSLAEALYEFNGYGEYEISQQDYSRYKKEFFANPDKWSLKKDRNFEKIFSIKKPQIIEIIGNILDSSSNQAPIQISSIIDNYRNIQLKYFRKLQDPIEVEYSGSGRTLKSTFYYNRNLSSCFIRYLLSIELFNFLYKSKNKLLESLEEVPEELIPIHANLFAAYLLVPDDLLKIEIAAINSSCDIIQQLADKFLVSPSLITRRLWQI